MKKILLTAPAHPVLRETLSAKGFTVVEDHTISYDDLLEMIGELEGLVVTTRLPIDATLIKKGTRLKWIGRLGSGMELIDAEAAAALGITCISTPEGNSNAVAEHTLALLLNAFNHITRAHIEVGRMLWLRDENRGTELAGKTVGIIGYGHTGSAFARLLQPFGVQVLAYDKYKKGFAHDYIRESSTDEISREAEVVSLHLPLTLETKGLANENFFSGLKRQPLFISTCRGKVTDTAALINALEKGQLRGAALDVLENEKLSQLNEMQKSHFEWLTQQRNVLLTPHIAGYSYEGFKRMAEVLLQKLSAAGLI